MQITLSDVVKEALEVPHEKFCETVEEATKLLRAEKGKVGNLHFMGRLITTKPPCQALVVGDLHGDLESLIQVLKESNILRRMSQTSDTLLIFLGDYGDRGEYSTEIYYTILKLKIHYPRQIILMRGNHEGPTDLMASPHDFPRQLEARFGEKWIKAYDEIRELFEQLYTALIVEKNCLMIHGGVPQHAETIEDLAYAHVSHPRSTLLEEMLWSDPDETVKETLGSPRGAGKLFSENVTNRALAELGVKILIRGHEACEEGFKINHNGRVLTLFSRKGPPYFNTHGAYLDMNFSGIENAEQLIPYIHKF